MTDLLIIYKDIQNKAILIEREIWNMINESNYPLDKIFKPWDESEAGTIFRYSWILEKDVYWLTSKPIARIPKSNIGISNKYITKIFPELFKKPEITNFSCHIINGSGAYRSVEYNESY